MGEKRTPRSRRSRRREKSRLRPGWILLFLTAAVVLTAGILRTVSSRRDWRERIALRDTPRELETEVFPGDERAAGTRNEETYGGGNGAVPDPGASGTPALNAEAAARERMSAMTVEEKVLQLFMITPEALTGVDEVYAAGARTKDAIEKYPVGGIVYFRQNLRSPEQVTDMLARVRKYSRDRVGVDLLIGIDEEGGEVSRISGREEFGIPAFPDMREIGDEGDPEKAYEVGAAIGTYLSKLGFNLDFAPVADVLTNPGNTVVARRSFGTDGPVTAQFVRREMEGLQSRGVCAVLKHFPGHGGTVGDTHEGYAYTDRTLEELEAEELVPFQEGIDAGARFVMAAHIAAPQVTGGETPASLSETLITDVLRKKMGFDGVVVTDALNMEAVTARYSSSEAAVTALQAGADLLLMPENFEEAYQGVLAAVKTGAISKARLEESVLRILRVKMELD